MSRFSWGLSTSIDISYRTSQLLLNSFLILALVLVLSQDLEPFQIEVDSLDFAIDAILS